MRNAAGDRRLHGSSAERAFRWLYDRLGPRILFVAFAGAVVLSVVGSAAGWAPGARYLGLSFEQAISVYALTLPTLLAFGCLGVVPSLGQLRTILAWSKADHDEETAIETWDALIRIRVMVMRAVAIGSIGLVPFAIYVTLRFHEPWWSTIVLFIAPATQAAALMVFLVALGELAVRPMLEDVAGYLPPDFAPSRQGLALGVKALAPLPLITFFAAGLAGAYGSIGTKGIARLSIGLGVGLATIAIATVIYLIVNRSVLAPIDDLIAATHRVRAGDVRTRIPLLSADELGDLVQSFNEMLDGLSERESLRDELVSQAEELRASRERIVAAADEERRRVERDLHDGAQQQLVLLRLKLGQLERDPGRRELIAEIRDDVERALAELRDLAHGLYPQALEAVGLRGALREAADRAPIAVTIDCDGTGRYRPELEAAVYFCCLEALQNAAKHAGEDARAAVTLAEDGGALKFEVSDDGRGFDAQETGGAGLQNMTDRIGALGGELKIASTPGTGTRVAGVIPLES